MLSRDQKCVTKHILEMNTTLFRFRDPVWCIQSQLNERMWSCEPHWRSIQRLINFGTPFFVFLEISKFNVKFVITWFKLYYMLKLTLTLLACYDWGYNRSPRGHTWPWYQKMSWNEHKCDCNVTIFNHFGLFRTPKKTICNHMIQTLSHVEININPVSMLRLRV